MVKEDAEWFFRESDGQNLLVFSCIVVETNDDRFETAVKNVRDRRVHSTSQPARVYLRIIFNGTLFVSNKFVADN